MKIEIRNHSNELLLTTSDSTFESDIMENYDTIENLGFPKECQYDGFYLKVKYIPEESKSEYMGFTDYTMSDSKVSYKDKLLKSSWNFRCSNMSFGDGRNFKTEVVKILLVYLKEDFENVA